jgi:hypothetical protein
MSLLVIQLPPRERLGARAAGNDAAAGMRLPQEWFFAFSADGRVVVLKLVDGARELQLLVKQFDMLKEEKDVLLRAKKAVGKLSNDNPDVQAGINIVLKAMLAEVGV